MSNWTYQGKSIDTLPDHCVGFVYLIVNLANNRCYVGKKLAKFSKIKYKTVKLKNGNKKRKKIKELVDSDWKTYWSSSKDVQADVKTLGEDKFKREILMFCLSKGTATYYEAKYQFQHEVLEKPDEWYNGQIQCRIHRSHLKYED